ncbi:MAG: hypothetical protein HeimAB125_08940 [Candidatus Heimdallarchaeota archaeon AB_125]|nr:MAG: hypothetical protein HeimAB125_08940 [Candidatus Heimdallarchaeota archaeon AB_125]
MENLLDRVFKISQYITDENFNVQNQEFRRDPWTMDPLPELYISSEKLNIQVARLVQVVKNGKAICSIMGDIKSGKSYLMNLLKEGLKESLWKYANYDKIFIVNFTSDEFKEYSLTNFLQNIADQVLGKYYSTKEQIIVELKKYVMSTNSLLVVLLDNFNGDNLYAISQYSAKILKLLRENYSCIISFNLSDMPISLNGLKNGGWDHFTYLIRIADLSLEEAKELIRSRMCYALNQSSFRVTEVFSELAIEEAWNKSKGNPWILISILSDAYSYSQKKGSKSVSHEDVVEVIDLFSRSTVQDGLDDHEKFLYQQVLNNLPHRERQVCEYLIHKDASAKEITLFLYGELSSTEYRSKYMGTKSFLKRLKEKNIVVMKGQKGRSFLFGLNPKMKERLLQRNGKDLASSYDGHEFVTT